MTDWVLRRKRICDVCGKEFPAGTNVGLYLSHVRRCK